MTNAAFYKTLFIVTAACGAVFGVLALLIPAVFAHWPLAIISAFSFVLISAGLFIAGKNTTDSRNKNTFNALISGSVFGKMVLAIAILYVYQQAFNPQDQWFVGVFLMFYVVFTVFEVWFMTQLAMKK